MTEKHTKKAVIVGGGPTGSLAGIFLKRRGYDVEIYEKRSDSRIESVGFKGKSINLALSERGLHALDKVGLKEAMLQGSIKMPQRIIHDMEGNITRQDYGRPGENLYSVSRRRLNEVILSGAEAAGCKIFFEHKCIGVDLKNTIGRFTKSSYTDEDFKLKNVKADIIIGADGVHSAVRHQMEKFDRFSSEQLCISHGYKELCIPPTKDGEFAMDPNGLHIWPRNNGDFMMIALPNLDKSFTVTLFCRYEHTENNFGFDLLKTKDDVDKFFRKYFKDVYPDKMPTLMDDFFGENPTPFNNLITIKCYPHHCLRTVIMGDAAHAVVPFYGQGVNCSLIDALTLDNLLDEFNEDICAALKEYTKRRYDDAVAIRNLSLQHYYDMSKNTAIASYHLLNKYQHDLRDKCPNYFTPLYSMVSFSIIPYHKAIEISKEQAAIITQIFEDFGVHFWVYERKEDFCRRKTKNFLIALYLVYKLGYLKTERKINSPYLSTS